MTIRSKQIGRHQAARIAQRAVSVMIEDRLRRATGSDGPLAGGEVKRCGLFALTLRAPTPFGNQYFEIAVEKFGSKALLKSRR